MDRSDGVAKVQEAATALAEKVRDARLDERAAELAAVARTRIKDAQLDARAAELAAAARRRAQETGVEDWAGDIVARVRDSALAQQAAEAAAQVGHSARDATDRTLETMGEWLADTPAGERLGIRRRRSRRPWAIVAGLAAAGVAAGAALTRRARDTTDDDVWGTAPAGAPPGERAPSAAPGVAMSLEARVREAIGQDPRTSSIGGLNVNVVDGTVFVRGSVGSDVDQEALRAVVRGVEGVQDVDLQVTVSA